MAYVQYNSPFRCWKGYERVPGTQAGAKGSCRKSSPANKAKGGGTPPPPRETPKAAGTPPPPRETPAKETKAQADATEKADAVADDEQDGAAGQKRRGIRLKQDLS